MQEDRMTRIRIYMPDNRITIIVRFMDKTRPEGDAMATMLTKELFEALEGLN